MKRTHLLRYLAPLAIAIVASTPALAATYYLSPTGKDDNPGTRRAPWGTLAKASTAPQPGDTVILLPGKHPGVLEPATSGKAGAPITYRSEKPLAAVLTGGTDSDGKPRCVRLKGREYLVLDGFLLLPEKGGWLRMDASNRCVIRNCRMENATQDYSPIECNDSHYNRFENIQALRSNNIGQWGHVVGDMWNNFKCTHNVYDRIHVGRAGHRPFGLWPDCSYNVIRRSVFDSRWGRNFEFFSTQRLLMEDCVVTNGFDGSGSADGRAKLFIIDSIFRRNAIYRNHYGPMVINAYQYGDMDPFGMLRSRVYHNTWYRNHEFGYQMIDIARNPDPHLVAGNVFQNNIFAGNDPGGDGLALHLSANIAVDNLFRYNLLYGDRPGSKTVRYDWPGPGAERWEGLAMTATETNEMKPAQFAGNLDADPRFLNPDADDYRLRPDSPAVDAGRPLATTTEAGSGRRLPVDDARPFYDGFGIPGEQGDLLFIGAKKKQARVVKADIAANVLELDRDLKWEKGEGVSLPYRGAAPDLGAYEQGAEREPWYAAPHVPQGLRLLTMETTTKPVVVTDFEPENLEEWHYYWNFSRQKNTNSRMDDTTAASGKRSMCVFATKDGAILSCDIRPRWWDIDRFPTVRVSYRIPAGVPVGLWLYPFNATEWGRGAVCVGGTATRKVGPYKDLDRYRLVDDDQWHEVTIDARVIREVHPNVKLLQMFRFYTVDNGKEGQQYWFDNFRILPR